MLNRGNRENYLLKNERLMRGIVDIKSIISFFKKECIINIGYEKI
ncbi:hypothetical protein HMPREF1983_00403 [Gemella bergeri ATCC 700627]|uniref:Uncharacterized protein n=1 Tax=Gemella bergeri ATCC 700627 TaxID=1321820 RepID=U2SAJ5_9BACL|nr:hypothetical protein HMPREF1983_00403 [Gemella bergeri ATCC 700627]